MYIRYETYYNGRDKPINKCIIMNEREPFETRNKINIYTCPKCAHKTITVDREDGVTPAAVECTADGCEELTHTDFYRCNQNLTPTHEFVKVSDAEIRKIAGICAAEMPQSWHDGLKKQFNQEGADAMYDNIKEGYDKGELHFQKIGGDDPVLMETMPDNKVGKLVLCFTCNKPILATRWGGVGNVDGKEAYFHDTDRCVAGLGVVPMIMRDDVSKRYYEKLEKEG